VQGGPRGDSVWLFALDGTLEQAPPAQQSTVRLTSNANVEVNLEAGKTAYFNSCVFCHGVDGTGGHGGPAFDTSLSAETIQRTVSGGRNQMPAFGSFLDEAGIANVSAWVGELARRAEGKQSH
jgi:mono/diheme cytochrome c family protein